MSRSLILSLSILSVVFTPSLLQAQTTGDADGNGSVDFVDFVAFAGAWGSTQARFDLSGNGTVDFPDFLIFVEKYQEANPLPPPAPEISVSATNLDFGDVQTGQSSSLTLTISNTGNADLSVTGVASSDGQFSATGSFPVEAGSSQDVTVTFIPGSTGSQSGMLTIGNNDVNESSLLVSLSGNVVEWVADWFDPNYYVISPMENPKGPSNGDGRVWRGVSATFLKNFAEPTFTDSRLGFRCAREP